MVQKRAGRGLEPAEIASDPAERASELAVRGLEPAGRAWEPAERALEPAVKAVDQAEWALEPAGRPGASWEGQLRRPEGGRRKKEREGKSRAFLQQWSWWWTW